ncbi:MAG TPA: hypothetical protein VNO30_37360 [Kofleriaceae bacterium]|nr:hypothetical protein [Kofleriaceae bacterium]
MLDMLKTAIGELMSEVIDLQGRRWAGVDPARDPGPGELAVFLVDARRMATEGCDDPLSASCRAGQRSVDSCAAIDERAIACDARFLALFANLALDGIRDNGILRPTGDQLEAAQRVDAFFASTYRSDIAAQLEQLGTALGEAAIDVESFVEVLVRVLDVVLTHELGHIALGHVQEHAILQQRSEVPDGSAADQESVADEFAIRQIMRRSDGDRLLAGMYLLVQLDVYTFKLSLLSSSITQITTFDKPGSPDDQIDKAIVSGTALICSRTHATPPARFLRLAHAPAIAEALAKLPPAEVKQAIEELEDLVAARERLCAMAEHSRQFATLDRETAAAAAVPLAITVTDTGKLPRERLRYRWSQGATLRMERRVELTKSMKPGSTPPRTTAHSTTVLVQVQKVRADRSAAIELKVEQSDLPDLAGRSAVINEIIEDRGIFVTRQVMVRPQSAPEPWAVASRENARRLSIPSVLGPGMVALPKEPIGVGGVWTVSGGGERWVTTYRLLSRNGPHLIIQATFEFFYAMSKRSSTAIAGSRSIHIDLGLPAPTQDTWKFSTVDTFDYPRSRQEFTQAIVFTSKTIPSGAVVP